MGETVYAESSIRVKGARQSIEKYVRRFFIIKKNKSLFLHGTNELSDLP